MKDFVFGTLATGELRLAHERARRGGITHRQARLPRDPLPGEPVALELTVGPDYAFDQAWVYWTSDGSDPEGAFGTARNGFAAPMETTRIVWDTLLWGYVRHFQVVLPGQPAGTVVRYYLAAGSTGEAGGRPEIAADQGALYAYYVDNDPLPEWARDAVVYQIFVDRFYPGDGKAWLQPGSPGGFYGGKLRGITQKLDYLKSLGANTLWLTPVFSSPSHHGYDATDLFDIEPRLGTKADLRELLDAAHSKDLRVLLDFVPNHWSNLHPTFKHAISTPGSPYRQWYQFHNWPDEYESFFGVKSLPQINLRHPAARQHLLDAAAYWLQFGLDGFRLDYAIGPSPDFWADFRRVTRAVRPDCWTFGEVVEPSDSQIALHGLLDGCLDFMLLEALRQAFAFGDWTVEQLASFLDRHERFFPDSFSRPSFLDNHDMNRFLWAVEGNQQKLMLAALCQFTLQGPPVIYYGTEVGLSQERDVRQGELGLPEEARLPMLWGSDQDAELLSFYRRLIQLRQANVCLRRGERQTVIASQGIFAYVRLYEGERLATVINLNSDPRPVVLPGKWDGILLSTGPGVRLQPAGHGASVDLPPLSGAVLGEGLQ